ncbi:probable 1-acylglycerol-3-phosphate O-acyltransferase isoform X2 [Phragmites australis]|uniref:probable 1-acylglycerol-3-phosphate O-acyltransferase isoform X2 n=1 Tax=Phragmites australis TaxID=29695 RepID=UPI002D779002|nr:probable 1-acylglycerol-3-phosphate O-acyltransferase isoform X2 [Phragmites australis]
MNRAAPATRMAAEEMRRAATAETTASPPAGSRWARVWPPALRWIPTSTDRIIAAEKRLLSVVKTGYVQEQVNIGSAPPGSKVRWFRSSSDEPRFINTVTFDSKENAPTLVMVHGYAASQGFFFRNFDALADRFRVIAIDQLGWGGSSRPDFTCKSTEETEAWFIDSLEEWRKAKNLSNFILLGHSFGGYVAAKYALQHPEHVRHLILVGPAGFSSETEHRSEWLTKFRATWKGMIVNHLWQSNFTPQRIVSASDWTVPTTFIYGQQDWMNYQGAQQARKEMEVPCEIIRVPQGGHFVFIDNPSGFHSAIFYACRKILSGDGEEGLTLPDGLISA